MTTGRIIILLSVVTGAAAAALGFTAFRLAQHDRNYRLTQTGELLKGECRVLAERCREELEKYRTNTVKTLEALPANAVAAEQLRRTDPLLCEVFLADADGRLLFPRDGSFVRRYEALLEEPIGTPSGKRGDAALTTRFSRLVSQARNGWIPWFAGNRFCPLVWTRSRNSRRIVGAELETMALLARLMPRFPQQFPAYYRFELVDDQGQVIASAGGGNADGEQPRHLDATVTLPVAGELVPNWQIRGYLLTDRLPSGGFQLALLMQIASLLVIILAAGGVALGLIRREMDQARLKTSFVANVSHELKTPLTSIRMYAEMLRDLRDRLSPEKQRKYLDIMLNESERLTRLIANVLDFSRLEAGRKKYRPESLDLAALLRELAEQWQPILADKNIRLELTLPDEPGATVIDRDSLIQVVQNLLSNAVKYAASSGWVGVALQTGERGETTITVSDHGPGIPRACRGKLFQKFYRCDDRITAETSGSGLGLSIARRLIRDQGGDLTFHPQPGGGAGFTIHLPGVKS